MQKMTARDATESITGFEEIAIERQFGADLGNLTPTMAARAIVFVLLTRENSDPVTSYNEVMKMSMRAVEDSFEKDEKKEAGNE